MYDNYFYNHYEVIDAENVILYLYFGINEVKFRSILRV